MCSSDLVPNVLVMNTKAARQLKIASVADLIAHARKNPGQLNYGSGGNGSAGHLAGELFKQQAGIEAALPRRSSPSRTASSGEKGSLSLWVSDQARRSR